ncbi:RAD55 family ATPase [Mycolicibacter longobardus]|uniref:SF4 helicase domain-containing protein n=1 Tax=Mycolicibacter longobardus TaxID=1108812 RepID=A0A1X1YK67_9MYCO|nr:DnaB-like helicase C-terminal domain-containing protein [Mycolicibacter longobardus]MCV7383922.1 hypothetical protein [Mycolicibacter longobardus]ORW11529.1 hypothetical protein AWC16_10555 [Mycolicibacter longobardus]
MRRQHGERGIPKVNLIQTNDHDSDRIEPVPTGFREIDAALGGGLQPGSLTIIAGHTGSGVTALATHIAKRLVTDTDTAANILAFGTTLDQLERRIRADSDPPAERSFIAGQRELHGGRLRISETHDREPGDILRRLSIELWTSEPRASLIVVDSLNMVGVVSDDLDFPRSPKIHSPTMSDFCRHLKGVALEENIAVIATTTFAVSAGVGMEPGDWIEHLPSVGPAAVAADNVLLLYRPDRWDRHTPREGEVDVVLAKGAAAPKTCTAEHQLTRGKFADFPINPRHDPQ